MMTLAITYKTKQIGIVILVWVVVDRHTQGNDTQARVTTFAGQGYWDILPETSKSNACWDMKWLSMCSLYIAPSPMYSLYMSP